MGLSKETEVRKKQLGNLKPFKKGDPRINRTGAKKKLPAMQELMQQILGVGEGDDPTRSEAAKIILNLLREAKSTKASAQKVAAAKELFERAFGKVKDVVDVKTTQVIWNETKTYKK